MAQQEQRQLRVRALLDAAALRLELLIGEDGLDREILSCEVQKPGLALAGHLETR